VIKHALEAAGVEFIGENGGDRGYGSGTTRRSGEAARGVTGWEVLVSMAALTDGDRLMVADAGVPEAVGLLLGGEERVSIVLARRSSHRMLRKRSTCSRSTGRIA
jgi:hypothetical protein